MVKYVDINDRMCGPFTLHFDPVQQSSKLAKQRLELNSDRWVRFDRRHADRVSLPVLFRNRRVIDKVFFSVEAEDAFVEFNIPEQMADAAFTVNPQVTTLFVQLQFTDGSKSGVVKYQRPPQ